MLNPQFSQSNYEEILKAETKGVLWPTGPCLTSGCSAEIQINRGWLQEKRKATYHSQPNLKEF